MILRANDFITIIYIVHNIYASEQIKTKQL